MPWVKLDGNFPHHPKVRAAGDTAAWLYVAGLCFCQTFLTDGRISNSSLKHLCGISQPVRYAKKLVSVGLWDEAPDGDGWIVHDYDLHQRSKTEVEKIREQTRNRVKKHRSNAVTNANVTLPDTDTDTDTENTLALTKSTRKKSTSKNPPKQRQRDPLFEATAEAVGLDWHKLTASERGRLNAAVGELRDIEATPDDVRQRATRYREIYPGMSLTATALSANWSSLTPEEYVPIQVAQGARSPRDLPDWDEDKFYGPHGPVLIDFAS